MRLRLFGTLSPFLLAFILLCNMPEIVKCFVLGEEIFPVDKGKLFWLKWLLFVGLYGLVEMMSSSKILLLTHLEVIFRGTYLLDQVLVTTSYLKRKRGSSNEEMQKPRGEASRWSRRCSIRKCRQLIWWTGRNNDLSLISKKIIVVSWSRQIGLAPPLVNAMEIFNNFEPNLVCRLFLVFAFDLAVPYFARNCSWWKSLGFGTVVHFVVTWQIIFNYRQIRLKRFI